jgi:hypothetical protein
MILAKHNTLAATESSLLGEFYAVNDSVMKAGLPL